MSCGFVLGNNAFVNHAIDDRYSRFIGSGSSVFVAGITGVDDVLNLGAHHRAQTHIVLAGLLRLAGALAS